MGQPARRHGRAAAGRRVCGGAPGELKHLSTPRKREDSPSSGERAGRSPNRGAATPAGVGGPSRPPAGGTGSTPASRTDLEGPTRGGESPVGEGGGLFGGGALSTTGEVAACGKRGYPRSKAKYPHRPIVDEYREGQVKRTPGGE